MYMQLALCFRAHTVHTHTICEDSALNSIHILYRYLMVYTTYYGYLQLHTTILVPQVQNTRWQLWKMKPIPNEVLQHFSDKGCQLELSQFKSFHTKTYFLPPILTAGYLFLPSFRILCSQTILILTLVKVVLYFSFRARIFPPSCDARFSIVFLEEAWTFASENRLTEYCY